MSEEELDDPEEDLDYWRGDMRRLLMRYQMLMWAGAPVIAFVPIWASHRDNHIEGAGWIGPIIIAVIFIPIWLMFGKLFLAFRTMFAAEEQADREVALARQAERRLAIRRAERLERAEVRHARIVERQRSLEQRRLALDVDRIRRSLDSDPENDDE